MQARPRARVRRQGLGLVARTRAALGPLPRVDPTPREEGKRRGGSQGQGAHSDHGMGGRHARPPERRRMVGAGQRLDGAPVHRDPLDDARVGRSGGDARHPGGGSVGGVLDGQVAARGRGRWRVREREGAPLLHGQHGARPPSPGLRGRPSGPQDPRMAGPDRPPEGGLVLPLRQERAGHEPFA